MIRRALIEIALFLTPFALYVAFVSMTKVGSGQPNKWAAPRVMSLLVVSLLLVVGGFLALALFPDAPPNSTYVPAHVENGKFVPGTMR